MNDDERGHTIDWSGWEGLLYLTATHRLPTPLHDSFVHRRIFTGTLARICATSRTPLLLPRVRRSPWHSLPDISKPTSPVRQLLSSGCSLSAAHRITRTNAESTERSERYHEKATVQHALRFLIPIKSFHTIALHARRIHADVQAARRRLQHRLASRIHPIWRLDVL